MEVLQMKEEYLTRYLNEGFLVEKKAHGDVANAVFRTKTCNFGRGR